MTQRPNHCNKVRGAHVVNVHGDMLSLIIFTLNNPPVAQRYQRRVARAGGQPATKSTRPSAEATHVLCAVQTKLCCILRRDRWQEGMDGGISTRSTHVCCMSSSQHQCIILCSTKRTRWFRFHATGFDTCEGRSRLVILLIRNTVDPTSITPDR